MTGDDAQLRTARLVLTPWTAAEVDDLLALFRAPSVRRFLLDDAVVGRDFVEAQLAASDARLAAGSLGMYSARAVEGALVGFGGFMPSGEPARLELVYGLDLAHCGRGLATEMALALAARYFARTDEDHLWAAVDAPNTASIRVLERLGMQFAGEVPGPQHALRRFTLARAAWEARTR